MKWNVSVNIQLDIEYEDIEAETEEEAKAIAEERAAEDVEYNNAALVDISAYCAWSEDEEREDNYD